MQHKKVTEKDYYTCKYSVPWKIKGVCELPVFNEPLKAFKSSYHCVCVSGSVVEPSTANS